MTVEIVVPMLGESVSEATVGKWLKRTGDVVKADEPLVELETDKVTLEVNAPAAGVLGEGLTAEGETVAVGARLGRILSEEGDAPAEKAKSRPPARKGGGSTAAANDLPSAKPESGAGEHIIPRAEASSGNNANTGVKTDQVARESGPAVARRDDAGVANGGSGTGQSSDAKVVADGNSGRDLSPAVRRVATEADVDLRTVAASGPHGHILKGDVLAALDKRGSAATVPAHARSEAPAPDKAREERVRMTRLRQTIARRLKDAQNVAAMLTTFNEIDMTNVMAARSQYKDLFEKKYGTKLGFMGFFVRAVTAALKEIPAINAEIDGEDIVYKNYYHIGVAVGTPRGLVVPVLRDADRLDMAEIERTIAEFGARARDGRLSIGEMQGGTFTVSNGGVYGSLMSTPILNAPQSGILGMHKIQDRPVAVAGQVVVRPMMYLALTYDHRIVDGREAVTFLVRVKETLEDPQRLLLGL